MEAVGVTQSEAEVSAGAGDTDSMPDWFLSDDEFDDIFAAADKDRITDSLAEEETPSQKAEQQADEAEHIEARQKTAGRLAAHFGSQQFVYEGARDTYRGTITQILALCPVFDSVLDEGFEYARDTLEQHKVVEEQLKEDTADEELKDDSKGAADTDTSLGIQDTARQNGGKGGARERVAPVIKVATEEKEHKTPSNTENSDTQVSGAEVSKESEETTTSSEPEALSLHDVPVENSSESTPIEQLNGKEAAVDFAAQSAIEEVHKERQSELADDSRTELQVSAVSVEPAVEPDQPVDFSVDESPEEKEFAYVVADVDEPVSLEESAGELTNLLDEVREPSVDVVESEETLQADMGISTYFDTWREVAHDEPPLEELFSTIADQLESTLIQDDEETAVELEFIAHHHVEAEVDDEELASSSHPEIATLYKSVRSASKAVEALYTARTKEECAFYIQQIVQELTIILRSLGYENPELVIRSFLSSHSPESLKSLIAELENSLRRAMVREIQQRRASHAKNRHTRLSKFVGFIMQALAPNSGAFSEAA